MNIVEKWMEHANRKYPSLAAGVRNLNAMCGLKLQPGQLYRIRDGRAKLPECIHNQMLAEVLPTLLENHDLGKSGYIELLDGLSVPLRRK